MAGSSTPYPIRLKPRERDRIEDLVEAGEFENVAEFIHSAINHFFYYLEMQEMRRFLMSDDVKTDIRTIVNEELRKAEKELNK